MGVCVCIGTLINCASDVICSKQFTVADEISLELQYTLTQMHSQQQASRCIAFLTTPAEAGFTLLPAAQLELALCQRNVVGAWRAHHGRMPFLNVIRTPSQICDQVSCRTASLTEL